MEHTGAASGLKLAEPGGSCIGTLLDVIQISKFLHAEHSFGHTQNIVTLSRIHTLTITSMTYRPYEAKLQDGPGVTTDTQHQSLCHNKT